MCDAVRVRAASAFDLTPRTLTTSTPSFGLRLAPRRDLGGATHPAASDSAGGAEDAADFVVLREWVGRRLGGGLGAHPLESPWAQRRGHDRNPAPSAALR